MSLSPASNPSFAKSSFYMVIATVGFFVQEVLIKLLVRIPTSEIVFFRSIAAFVFSAVWLYHKKISFLGTHKKLLILRGLFGTGALFCYFYSLKFLPLAIAAIVQKLSPFFLAILSAVFLKRPMSFVGWLCLICSFAGVILIKGYDPNIPTFPLMLALLGGIFSSFAYLMIGLIGNKENAITIIFYFPLVTLPIITPFTIANWMTPDFHEAILLLLSGIVVQTAQIYMTKAFQSPYTSRVSVIYYLGSLLAVLYGVFVFGETLKLNSAFGIALILVGVVANSLFKPKLIEVKKI